MARKGRTSSRARAGPRPPEGVRAPRSSGLPASRRGESRAPRRLIRRAARPAAAREGRRRQGPRLHQLRARGPSGRGRLAGRARRGEPRPGRMLPRQREHPSPARAGRRSSTTPSPRRTGWSASTPGSRASGAATRWACSPSSKAQAEAGGTAAWSACTTPTTRPGCSPPARTSRSSSSRPDVPPAPATPRRPRGRPTRCGSTAQSRGVPVPVGLLRATRACTWSATPTKASARRRRCSPPPSASPWPSRRRAPATSMSDTPTQLKLKVSFGSGAPGAVRGGTGRRQGHRHFRQLRPVRADAAHGQRAAPVHHLGGA